jgi:hypothetical protein
MNEETVIDELVRDITRAGSMPKSEVRERIQSLLSLHDKKLVEKIFELQKVWTVELETLSQSKQYQDADDDGQVEMIGIRHNRVIGFNQALDLAAQVIEGQSTNSEHKQLNQ